EEQNPLIENTPIFKKTKLKKNITFFIIKVFNIIKFTLFHNKTHHRPGPEGADEKSESRG
ncbi:MAG: hypothetical protein ACI9CQ_004563, partial [Saprospiraceae bacterium]